MTPLPSSRVLLLLETTKNTKPACSTAKIKGGLLFGFWLGVLVRSAKAVSGKFRSIDFYLDRSISGKVSIDRLRAKFRSIDFSGPPNFQSFSYEICHSSLIVLQKQKTQKLTKTLEHNKAKGLTSANQGVQIHNIWHLSDCTPKFIHIKPRTCNC
jgi:hypothetical protein